MTTDTQPLIVFSHGQEGVPWGDKIVAMAEVARTAGYEVDSIDYRGMEPLARVEKLRAYCRELNRVPLLVGSSLGGHVSAAVSREVNPRGLFLLAPAFFMPGYEQYTPTPAVCPIEIVHGWRDDVVPVENSIRWARLYNAVLHIVDDEHRLTDSIDRVCELLRLYLSRLARQTP